MSKFFQLGFWISESVPLCATCLWLCLSAVFVRLCKQCPACLYVCSSWWKPSSPASSLLSLLSAPSSSVVLVLKWQMASYDCITLLINSCSLCLHLQLCPLYFILLYSSYDTWVGFHILGAVCCLSQKINLIFAVTRVHSKPSPEPPFQCIMDTWLIIAQKICTSLTDHSQNIPRSHSSLLGLSRLSARTHSLYLSLLLYISLSLSCSLTLSLTHRHRHFFLLDKHKNKHRHPHKHYTTNLCQEKRERSDIRNAHCLSGL